MTGAAPTPSRIALTDIVRLLMGMVFLVNGLNWWFKLIVPYPSQSDFVDFLPPPDVVGAMIENGVLFVLVKAAELAVGIALLANRFVPLAAVAALPITLPVFVIDVFFIAHLRGQVMGWGTLILNLYMLLASLGHYHGMMAVRMEATPAARQGGIVGNIPLATWLARLLEPVMTAFGIIAAITGLIMVIWLGVLITDYMMDPRPISSLFPLEPRI